MEKVFLTVPNLGEINVELAHLVIVLLNDKRYGVQLADLSNTARKPASHNRNKTVCEFLETDCDWFLTIDSDTIPNRNPLDLIQANQDIIGLPTRIIHDDHIMWNVFMENPETESYMNMDTNIDEIPADLVECHAVGSGCMLIKRKVLETIKAPFMRKWTSEGTQKTSHDIAFCEKARQAGFKVVFSPGYTCEHQKKIPLDKMYNIFSSYGVMKFVNKAILPKAEFPNKLYVVGTGRCGTKTIAMQCKGLHEPAPWVTKEGYEYYFGDYSNIEDLKHKLKIRASYKVPCISDHFQSYVIPVIREIDPNAEFLFLIRHPMQFVRSTSARNWYHQRSKYFDSIRIHPKDGWPNGFTDPMKCAWNWVETNKLILRDLEGANFTVEFTDNIKWRKTNSIEPAVLASVKFTDEEEHYINSHAIPLWEKLRGKYNG